MRQHVSLLTIICGLVASEAWAQRHDFGPVSPYEQYMLELVNSARAKPAAYALSLGIKLDAGLPPGSISPAPKPPLIFHPLLNGASQRHSADMLRRRFFDHVNPSGADPTARARAAGFGGWVGENIAAIGAGNDHDTDHESATSQSHIGLFRSPGHRANLLTDGYSFVGVGLRSLQDRNDGSQTWMTTQKFATGEQAGDRRPFITGVAYLDLDGDRFYSPGEGIGGVTVNVSGSSYWARTRDAGGFAVPVPGNGTYRVAFRVPGLGRVIRTSTVTGSRNKRLTLFNAARGPLLQLRGPAPSLKRSSPFALTPVAGSSRYDLQYALLDAASPEGAEPGQRCVALGKSEVAKSIQSAHVAEGNFAFRLLNEAFGQQSTLALRSVFLPSARGRIEFRSLLRQIAKDQTAMLQVHSRGKWNTVWRQRGTGFGDMSESSFRNVSVSLSKFAGEAVSIRFVLASNQSYGSGTGAGWFIDDIRFPGLLAASDWRTNVANGRRNVNFAPAEPGTYLLRARARFRATVLTGPSRTFRVKSE